MIQEKEVQSLRRLAARWMEHAANPVMDQRRRQWKAVKDLRAEKPMILVETCALPGYIGAEELVCTDSFARNVERSLYEVVRHADEIGDDVVVDPFFRVAWELEISDYGVRSAADAPKLHLRSRCVNRRESLRRKELLEDVFGDILPVRLGGWDPFNPDPGYAPWLGSLYAGLTVDLCKLIGNDALLAWARDDLPLLRQVMRVLREDRTAHFRFLENEGLLYANTDTWMPCPGSYGFVSGLSNGDGAGRPVSLKSCWCWTDSRESARIPSGVFDELFLPAIAEVTRPFGLTCYGCGEAVPERFDRVEKAIPNLRAVSVCGTGDLARMGELLGKRYVFSRTSTSSCIGGSQPDWDRLGKDLDDTLAAARGCNLEICFRDGAVDGDRSRLAAWARMARARIGE